MIKKLLLAALLTCIATAAHAQVATPNLDQGFYTSTPAAAGWRYNSTISLDAISADGDVIIADETEGTIDAGLKADGPDDSGSNPALLAVYKTGAFAAELWTSTTNGVNQDLEFDLPGMPTATLANAANIAGKVYLNKNVTKEEVKDTKLSFAYVFAETLSVGFGYHSNVNKREETVKGKVLGVNQQVNPPVLFTLSYDKATETEITTVGTSLDTSWRFADIFYLAGGVEAVKQTGTHKYIENAPHPLTGLPVKTVADLDYVENSWMNTNVGIGLVTGEPDGTQFKLEYSMISSPESVEEASDGDVASLHPKTTTTFITAEVKFSNVVLGFHREVELEKELEELNDQETETIITHAGLSWYPLEGMTLSLYSVAQEKKITKPYMGAAATALEEISIEPKGYRLFVGYNF